MKIKNIKKVLFATLIFSMLTTNLPIGAQAAGPNTITIATVSGVAGSNVQVPISVNLTETISTIGFVVSYDSANLELTGTSLDTTSATPLVISSEFNENLTYTSSSAKFFINWTSNNKIGTGTLFNLNFKIKNSISGSSFAVSFTGDMSKMLTDSAAGYLTVTATNGGVNSGTSQGGDSSGITITNPDFANTSSADYVVAYWDVNGNKVINPMSYYDSNSEKILYQGTGCKGVYNFVPFNDVSEGYWSSANIWFMSSRNVISGMGDGNFYPRQNVTRAQFLKMLAFLTPDENYSSYSITKFKDVSGDAWYAPYVGWGVSNSIVTGYDSNTFGPNDSMTREQMCVMLDRYLQYKGLTFSTSNESVNFMDAGSISSWATASVSKLQKMGLVNGMSSTQFVPKGKASREQAATVLGKLLKGMLKSMSNPSEIAWTQS